MYAVREGTLVEKVYCRGGKVIRRQEVLATGFRSRVRLNPRDMFDGKVINEPPLIEDIEKLVALGMSVLYEGRSNGEATSCRYVIAPDDEIEEVAA